MIILNKKKRGEAAIARGGLMGHSKRIVFLEGNAYIWLMHGAHDVDVSLEYISFIVLCLFSSLQLISLYRDRYQIYCTNLFIYILF